MGDLSSVNLPSRSFDAIAKKEAYFVVEDDKKLFVNNNIIHKEEKAKYWSQYKIVTYTFLVLT